MLVRIVRQPSQTNEGVSLHLYRAGRVYDVNASLAEYLVSEGFAQLEMRRNSKNLPSGLERRKRPMEIIEDYRTGRRIRE